MQFLSNLCQTSWIGKLNRVNKEHFYCSVCFSEELIAVFKSKKSQICTELDKKTQNFPIFKVFMQLLSKFRQTSQIAILKTVIKVRICCAVVFYEEIIAVFMLKNF